MELAKEGFNIILVSRSMEKLKMARSKILETHPEVEVEVHSIDFSKLISEEQYREAMKDLLKKDVSILVNNVGYLNSGTIINN